MILRYIGQRLSHHENLLDSPTREQLPDPVHPGGHPVNLEPALLVQDDHAKSLAAGKTGVPESLRQRSHESLEHNLQVLPRRRKQDAHPIVSYHVISCDNT